MAPKKKDPKSEKGQQKAVEKAKQKVVEDKTFGLKNKNKSKAVQKYIKNVQQQVKGPTKGPDLTAANQLAEKEEKKKASQQAALLASLFRGTENVKKLADDAKVAKHDPKTSKEEQKIDLYVDQRLQKDCSEWDEAFLEEMLTKNDTDIVCKHFVDAVEKKQYGWFWICPNGGDLCKYRHCLPEGYVLKRDLMDDEIDDEDEITIEEQIEEERRALPAGGTPVTLESFMLWKKTKEEERLKAVETERQIEAKRTGTRGLHILSGRDLFSYDPTLFIDDEGAASEEDYDEDEEYWNGTINENQRALDAANAASAAADGDEEIKRDDDGDEDPEPVKEDLFLDDIPDDLDSLDDEDDEDEDEAEDEDEDEDEA